MSASSAVVTCALVLGPLLVACSSTDTDPKSLQPATSGASSTAGTTATAGGAAGTTNTAGSANGGSAGTTAVGGGAAGAAGTAPVGGAPAGGGGSGSGGSGGAVGSALFSDDFEAAAIDKAKWTDRINGGAMFA